MNRSSSGIIKKQSKSVESLKYLRSHPPISSCSMNDADVYPNIMYSFLRKAEEVGLMSSRTVSRPYPSRKMISLTDKGGKVAKKLKEIEKILRGE